MAEAEASETTHIPNAAGRDAPISSESVVGTDCAGVTNFNKVNTQSPTSKENSLQLEKSHGLKIPSPETDGQSPVKPQTEVSEVIQTTETAMADNTSASRSNEHNKQRLEKDTVLHTSPIESDYHRHAKDEIRVIPVTIETMVEGSASSKLPAEVEISADTAEPMEDEVSLEKSDPNGVESLKRVTRRNRKFDVTFKVQVIEFAEEYSNRSAGKKFGVDEKRVREWRKQKEELKSSLPTPRKHRKGILSNHMKTVSKIPKRNFDAAFKIAAIEFAEANSNRSTGREFGVDEKQVREWRKQKEKLEKLPPGKKRLSGAGRKPAYPVLEEKLVAWIEAQKANEMRLTRADIQAKAVELSRADDSTVQFTASHGWLDNFFRRKHISLRH